MTAAAGEVLDTGSVWIKVGAEVEAPFAGQCLSCVLG